MVPYSTTQPTSWGDSTYAGTDCYGNYGTIIVAYFNEDSVQEKLRKEFERLAKESAARDYCREFFRWISGKIKTKIQFRVLSVDFPIMKRFFPIRRSCERIGVWNFKKCEV